MSTLRKAYAVKSQMDIRNPASPMITHFTSLDKKEAEAEYFRRESRGEYVCIVMQNVSID
jgi:hypothetical protein